MITMVALLLSALQDAEAMAAVEAGRQADWPHRLHRCHGLTAGVFPYAMGDSPALQHLL